MPLKMFFADYCEGKVLESEDARLATKPEILHSMDCVLHMPSNFIGIIDENDATLQFIVNDDKTVSVDIPVPANEGRTLGQHPFGNALKSWRGLTNQ